MAFRTDENNNPAAITTAVAKMALVEGVEFVAGTPFPSPSAFFTAHLLGDPVALTIKLIDTIGYYTDLGHPRWDYIALPKFAWGALTPDQKRDVVGYHYEREGGTAMRSMFPNYGIK